MSFLKKIFGSEPEENDEARAERERQSRFDTLKYDGVRAIKMGELRLAVRYLEHALTLNGDDAETCSYLAEVYLQTGDADKALPLLQRLTEQDPQNLRVLMALAQTHTLLNDWAAVEDTCAKALAIDGRRAGFLLFRANAAHGAGNDLSAVALLTQALTLDEGLAQAYKLRAEVLSAMQQYAEARKDADAFLQLMPEDEGGWMLKGDIEARAGQPAEAVEAYKKTLELNPFHREAVLKQGECLVTMGDTAAALALYDEAIALQADFSEAYKARGGVKLALGDKEGAMDDLKKMLETEKENGKAIADGEYSNIKNEMEARYRQQNPYGF